MLPRAIIFQGALNPSQQVPPTQTFASGDFKILLLNGKLYYKIHTQGLNNITGAHIHIGKMGENGPIVKNLNINKRNGNGSGVWTRDNKEQPLNSVLIQNLLRGELYINIHDVFFPDGAIRGQIFRSNNMPTPFEVNKFVSEVSQDQNFNPPMFY